MEADRPVLISSWAKELGARVIEELYDVLGADELAARVYQTMDKEVRAERETQIVPKIPSQSDVVKDEE